MENLIDQELIYNYLKKGDEKSLEILIRRYLKPIYGLAYRYVGNVQEAEDITQDVFVKVWKNLKKLAPHLPPWRDGAGFDPKKGNFKNWIFAIARNTALDFLKKKKTMQFADLPARGGSAQGRENEEWKDKFIDPLPLPDEFLERKGIREIFIKAAGKLFSEYRRVLLLRHEENLTFREISQRLNEPLNTVKSRHRRALLLLKKLLPKS